MRWPGRESGIRPSSARARAAARSRFRELIGVVRYRFVRATRVPHPVAGPRRRGRHRRAPPPHPQSRADPRPRPRPSEGRVSARRSRREPSPRLRRARSLAPWARAPRRPPARANRRSARPRRRAARHPSNGPPLGGRRCARRRRATPASGPATPTARELFAQPPHATRRLLRCPNRGSTCRRAR